MRQAATSTHPDAGAPRKRALIVEDDPFILLDMEDMLAQNGLDVVATALSKAEALQAARELEIDIATLDYDLAGETSEEVAELLNQRGIPFVVVSGKATTLADRPVFKRSLILDKPVDDTDLLRSLEAALA